MAGDANIYRYVFNRPTISNDPMGLREPYDDHFLDPSDLGEGNPYGGSPGKKCDKGGTGPGGSKGGSKSQPPLTQPPGGGGNDGDGWLDKISQALKGFEDAWTSVMGNGPLDNATFNTGNGTPKSPKDFVEPTNQPGNPPPLRSCPPVIPSELKDRPQTIPTATGVNTTRRDAPLTLAPDDLPREVT